MQANEFHTLELSAGETTTVTVDGTVVAVYNINGVFYATDDTCTHAGGPLSEGVLEGTVINCPWHGSCFDVTSGAIVCGPATEPVGVYRVTVNGEIGRVMTA